jgi:hypothetical protein
LTSLRGKVAAEDGYNWNMADVQSILTVGLPTLAVLMGILVNNSRLGDMNRRFDNMDRRFDDVNRQIDDFRESLLADFRRVEQAWTARVKHLEENR